MSTRNTPILLVEDNLGDAQLVKVFLKDAAFKYDLYHAETFFEGIELMNRNEIDIVLLDLSLPDSNGFKTLSRYLEKNPTIPVIVLTGTNNEIVGNQAVKAGAQDYLVKGQFDGKLLGRSIRYSLQRFKTQKSLEEGAREMSINTRRIVETQEMVRFGNWEMDLVSNSMVWTDEVYRVFGFQPNSFDPSLSDYINYVHIEDRKNVEDFFEKTSKDGKLHRIEHRIVVDGSSLKHLSLHAKVSFDDISQRFVMLGGIQDISDRKMNEQIIMEQNLNRRASKVKEEVLSDMSFHIRTPLSSIVNLLFLLGNSNISPQQKELVEGLKISVNDLSMMINNLLNFSMLVSEHLTIENEEFYIKDFLNSLKKVLHIKTDNANMRLDFSISNELPDKITSDPQKITQILYNLTENAIKNSQSGGKIIIDIKNSINADRKNVLNIKVIDNGTEMNNQKLNLLMNESKLMETIAESTENNQQLGLAIVNKLVHILEGNINLKSKENIGTTFDIELPIKVSLKSLISTNDGPKQAIKILLVEDHFLNQIATKKILTSWSELVTVDIAENGLVAVGKMREYAYDLILMDIQMPIMNGIDAALKIRETSNIPIIALTANASRQESEKCLEAGMNDYVSKPFKPEELYEKILTLVQE